MTTLRTLHTARLGIHAPTDAGKDSFLNWYRAALQDQRKQELVPPETIGGANLFTHSHAVDNNSHQVTYTSLAISVRQLALFTPLLTAEKIRVTHLSQEQRCHPEGAVSCESVLADSQMLCATLKCAQRFV